MLQSARGSFRSAGVSVIEMLFVVVLIGVTLGLAYPGLQALAVGAAVRAEAQRLLASLHLARAHAVTRGRAVTVCPRGGANGDSGRCGESFDAGWELLEADVGLLRSEAPPAAAIAIRRRNGSSPVGSALTYRPDGTTGRGATFRFCLPSGVRHPGWRVVVSASGRPRLARDRDSCA